MTSIETRPYGKAGDRVTVIGLGGGGLDQRSFADGIATVRRALELGVTYYDTSPLYGRTQNISQAILGEALEGRSEPSMVATKLGHFANLADFRSLTALRAQIDRNLHLLRRDSVDTLQVHEADWHCWWADDRSTNGHILPDRHYDFADAPVMHVLHEARAQGKCRFIGITGNTADNMARVLRHVDVDTFLVAFNYSLIWRSIHRNALPVVREKQVAFILGGILQGGRLTQGHPEWLSSPPQWMTSDLLDRFRRLYQVHQESGLSLVTLSIRYLLADPNITTILMGAAGPAEIEESVAAAQAGPLPPDLHRAVEELGVQ